MWYPESVVTAVPSVFVAGAVHISIAVPDDPAVTVTVALWVAVPPVPVQASV